MSKSYNHKKWFLVQSLPLIIYVALMFSCSSISNGHKPLPDFEVKDLNGTLYSNDNLKGKVVVINLWATWCGPCRKEIPTLNKLVQKYEQDSEVLFLAITDDTPEKIKSYLSKNTFSYKQIAGADALFSDLHKGIINTIPTNIVVNKKGEIIYYSEMVPPNLVEVLSAKIEKARLN